MNKMKKAISVIALVLCLILVVGCSTEKPAGPDVSVEDIYEAIKEQIIDTLRDQGWTDEDFEGEELPGYAVTDLKGSDGEYALPEINKGDVVEGIQIIAGFLNADQIIIIKAADGKAEAIKSLLETMKQEQYDFWSDYNAEQAAKINQTVISVKGSYILYATYEDAESLEAIFNQLLN